MRNSPLHPWQTSTDPEWSIDALPRMRLGLLLLVFLLPVLAVVGRLYWLQIAIADRYLMVWSQTTESFESLPAGDGRILSSDGQVLAYDEPYYEVHVHYRWLEDPINADWLTARARERLPKDDRKNADRVAASRAEILSAREQLWQSLSQLTGHSGAILDSRRAEVQRRVESLREVVAKRRSATRETTAEPSSDSWWDRVRHELTTSPDRATAAPLILKEELSAHRVIEELSVDRIAMIEAQPSLFPGVEIRQSSRRVYPQGDLAAHLIGLRTPLREDQWTMRQVKYPQGDPLALEVGDRLGETGLERSYDHFLRGSRGLQRFVRDHAGQVREQSLVRSPQGGRDLILTIDADLQRLTEARLDAIIAGRTVRVESATTSAPTAGSMVVLDLRQGELLIAASGPRISLAEQQHPTQEQWEQWSHDPGRPFLSRVSQAAVPPGSLFQIVTAVAALETGQCTPEELFHCQGYLNTPDRDRCAVFLQQGIGHGEVTLADAVAHSCHVFFCDAAERLGPRPIGDWAGRLGLGRPTGLDLLGEQGGRVPNRAAMGGGERWPAGTTRQLANGQAEVTVTPLQIARMMAILGNGGYAVTPRLTPLHSVESPAKREIELASAAVTTPSLRGPQIISNRTLQVIREGLELSVAAPSAETRQPAMPGLLIAARGGTATVGGDRPAHVWLAGYLPADRPRYAFSVYLEHGGSEPDQAAAVAHQVFVAMVEAGLLGAE
ncbi:MAG: hypothetical protein DWH91_00585 [Planctomycetota bacterium]|nr:MAG: hypothetical protein DWH91_00585 [Planctomycetota bacterium]